jgi:hypothetical protein
MHANHKAPVGRPGRALIVSPSQTRPAIRWSKGEVIMDDKGEPPSAGRAKSLFRIGKNSRGNWVVQDQSGLCGGLFVDRAEAVKFAMFENGNRPQAVIMVPGILELDLSRQPRDQNRSTADLDAPLARAA